MDRHFGNLLSGLFIFVGLVLLLSIARWDRGGKAAALTAENRPIVDGGQAVGPVPLPAVAPPVPPATEDADKAKSDAAIAKVAEARQELAQVAKQLEEKKKEIKQLEENQERPKMVADEANDERRQLEKRIEELEAGLKAAESKTQESQQALDALKKEHQARLAAVAQSGIARTLGRGALVDAQTRVDSRRFRDPSMPGFKPSAAAIAAAGASGGNGGGPSSFAGSTVAGDITRGNADLVRAAGQYNLNTSQAAINVETAKALATENRLRTTETFFEMRRVNRAARALEAGPRPTMEQVVRYARMGLPPRLSSRELDPLTGEIAWPIVLKDEAYGDDTAYIEKCFRDRAASAGLSFQQFTMVDDAFKSLKESLKGNVAKYPSAPYGEARTFVDSLQYEFQLPVN
jgi:hypothetical protein